MRNVDSSILTALEGGELREFLLIEILVAPNFYFTDCDVPIAWNGNIYIPRGLSIGGVSYSLGNVVDSVRLAVDNLDDLMTSGFVGGSPQDESVNIRVVVLDSNYELFGSSASDNIILFPGYVDDWRDKEGRLDITVVSAMSKWNKRTLRLQSSSCSWSVFKGTECQYSGAVTKCNRSYSTCTTLGNTANFGGERWLPSIESKEIVWGVRTKA